MEDKEKVKFGGTETVFRDQDLADYLGASSSNTFAKLVEDISDLHESVSGDNNLSEGDVLFSINSQQVKYKKDNTVTVDSTSVAKSDYTMYDSNGDAVVYADKTDGVSMPKVSSHLIDMAQRKNSPLWGKKLFAFGDSYIANNSKSVRETWWMRLAQKYEMDIYNFGISGAMTFAYGDNRLFDRFRNICEGIAEIFLSNGVITTSLYNTTLAKYGVSSENELSSEVCINSEDGSKNNGGNNPETEVWLDFYRDLFKDAVKDSYIILTGGRNDFFYIDAFYKQDGSYQGALQYKVDGKVDAPHSYGTEGRTEYYELDGVIYTFSKYNQQQPFKKNTMAVVLGILFSRLTYIFSTSKILYVLPNRYAGCNNLDNEEDVGDSYDAHTITNPEYRHSQIGINAVIMEVGKRYGIQFYDSQHESPVKAWNKDFRTAFMQSSSDSSHFNAEGHKFLENGIDEYLNSL